MLADVIDYVEKGNLSALKAKEILYKAIAEKIEPMTIIKN